MSLYCPYCREWFVSDDRGDALWKLNDHLSEHEIETPQDRRWSAP